MFFLCFYILFDFFLLAPTRFGLHRLARSQANPQTERSNFVVPDSDTKQVSQTIVLWLSLSVSLSLSFLSRSLVQVNLYYFFPTGKRPVLCMPRYEVKCLNYASFESSLLYLLLTHDLCALSPSVYQLVAC